MMHRGKRQGGNPASFSFHYRSNPVWASKILNFAVSYSIEIEKRLVFNDLRRVFDFKVTWLITASVMQSKTVLGVSIRYLPALQHYLLRCSPGR